MEVVRVLDSLYLDQAQNEFGKYVEGTLLANQAVGGRFNPPGEFGSLYCAGDEETAWEEAAARFRRQGVPNLPPDMGVIRILITVGRFADLMVQQTRDLWEVSEVALKAENPTPAQRQACWAIGRAVRAVGDFLRSPSARSGGANVPLFPDRVGRELRMELSYAARRPVPAHLVQTTSEPW
jgi:RES domain-containing protein